MTSKFKTRLRTTLIDEFNFGPECVVHIVQSVLCDLKQLQVQEVDVLEVPLVFS